MVALVGARPSARISSSLLHAIDPQHHQVRTLKEYYDHSDALVGEGEGAVSMPSSQEIPRRQSIRKSSGIGLMKSLLNKKRHNTSG